MNAAERWLEIARQIYGGTDEGKLFDRGMRIRGDVDRAVFAFAMLEELKAIRQLLESQHSELDKAGGSGQP